jgi:hypothetical protein
MLSCTTPDVDPPIRKMLRFDVKAIGCDGGEITSS